jgi:hypothetical protein
MTRGNAVLMSISAVLVTMAISVAAAWGNEPYRSPDSILVGGAESSESVSGEYRSPDSILAGTAGSSVPASGDYRSPDSVLATAGPAASPSVAVLERPAPSGFAWGDALIGALTGFGLALMAFAIRHAATRHRPVVARSSA